MRNSQAVIRGDRPTTRFAAPIVQPRARQLGLTRTTPVRLAQAPRESMSETPYVAIRSAARGHITVSHAIRPQPLRRPDAFVWSTAPNSVPHRTRPRSAAPWRG